MRLSHLLALGALAATLFAPLAEAQTQAPLSIKDGNGSAQSLCEFAPNGSSLAGCTINWFYNGSTWGLQPADSGFRPYVDVYSLPNVTLGAGSAVIGNIGNTTFGISGTLPAFATTPTFNLGSLNGAAQDGTDASGVTAPTGGVGIRGWLSGIYNAITHALPVKQVDSAGGDATDTTNHAVRVNCVVGCGTGGSGGAVSIANGQVASGAYVDCAITTLGCEADAAWSGTGSATLMAAIKKLDADINQPLPANSKVGIDQTTPGTTNAVQPIVGATGGATHYHLANGSTTGTPALNTIKGSAGTLLTLVAENATGTVEYLHVYDSAAPTCGSATGLAHVYMIPTNTSGAGFVIPIPVGGEAYTSAITYFVTGGEADTDCTAAVAGVLVEGSFK